MTHSETNATIDDALLYRSVHTGAVLGMMLGILSSVVLFTASSNFEYTVALSPIPLFGLIVSLTSWRKIAQASDMYTGGPMAKIGALLSVVFLVVGISYGGYVYATEVPEGYIRTSFLEIKPDENDIVNREAIPSEVVDYIKNQKKIFIKGYIRPDSIRFKRNLSDFLLVRDNRTCCFGDMSKVKYYDQIKVRLAPGLTTDYSSGIFRVGGILKVGPGDRELGTPLTFYLEADHIE